MESLGNYPTTWTTSAHTKSRAQETKKSDTPAELILFRRSTLRCPHLASNLEFSISNSAKGSAGSATTAGWVFPDSSTIHSGVAAPYELFRLPDYTGLWHACPLEYLTSPVTYTDALIESSDADGEMLGEEGVLRILKLLGDVKAEKLIDALLGEIAERYPENLSNDDVTLLIVRANGAAQSFTLGDKMRAAARMAGGVIRSLYPGRKELPSN